MNYERLDLLENMRHTLAQEARRCAGDTVYVDFLYREWQHYTVRLEREWRQYEGRVVPCHMREGHQRELSREGNVRRLV